MNLLARIALVAGAAGLAYLGVGVAAARYAILGRQRTLRIVGRPSVDVIRLPRMNATESPLTFGLQDSHGRLIVVGSVVEVGDGYIDRVIEADASLEAGQSVQLIGNVFGPDSELARSAVPVRAEAGGVVHQLWDIDPDDADDQLRFVHVHGLGAAPATTLRSVDAARQLGYASTIVSLDGSPDMTRRVNGIRASAAARVQWAIDHARGLGATRVVLVAWSFGAQLASEACHARRDVAGLVLISPTIDLLETVALEAGVRSVPSGVATAARFVLTTRALCRLARLDHPLPRRARANGAAELPALWMYSGRDETLTASNSSPTGAGASRRRSVEFASAPHTMEWNTDPALFAASISQWLSNLSGGSHA